MTKDPALARMPAATDTDTDTGKENGGDEEEAVVGDSIHGHHSKRLAPSDLPSVFVRVPNTAFGISMGLAGQSIVWKTASNATFIVSRSSSMENVTSFLNMIFWVASLMVLCVIGICYVYKILRNFDYVVREWRCAERTHFMNAPHLSLIMLSIGIPEKMIGTAPTATLRILWSIAFAAQTVITQFMYEHWFFSSGITPGRRLSCAKPQFLLSTVGWFLLSVLGSLGQIAQVWGLALPAFCLGAGIILYLMVVMNIFNDHSTVTRGSPALFLLIAPPSVAVIATDLLDNDDATFSVLSEVILGWCLVVVLLLLRLGPIIMKQPPVLGVYWAYVFPSSALATALLRYASLTGSASSHVLAMVFLVVSFLAWLIVCCRTCYHCVRCAVVEGEGWGDPLLQSAVMEGEDATTNHNRDRSE